jgi:hypothetical protein
MEFSGSFATNINLNINLNEVSKCSFLQALDPAFVDYVTLAIIITEGVGM